MSNTQVEEKAVAEDGGSVALVPVQAKPPSGHALIEYIKKNAHRFSIGEVQMMWANVYGVTPLGITLIEGTGHVNQEGMAEKWAGHLRGLGYKFVKLELRDLTPGELDESGEKRQAAGYDTYLKVQAPSGELKEIGRAEPLVINNKLVPTGEQGWTTYVDSAVARNRRGGGESIGILKMHAQTKARLRAMKALLALDGKPLPTLAEEMPVDMIWDGADVVTVNAEEMSSVPTSEFQVPFKKAKSLFDGQAPTVAQLYAKDPGYCQWIAGNVTDSKVGEAVRAYIATLSEEGGPEASEEPQAKEQPAPSFKEVQELPFTTDRKERESIKEQMKQYLKHLIVVLESAGYDNRPHRKNLLMELFDTHDFNVFVLGWFRLLERYACHIRDAKDEDKGAAKAYAKRVVAVGREHQLDWDGAVERLAADDEGGVPF